MGTFTTILTFVVMVVMAIAIIVLVIWVAKLSARLRMLSDTIFKGDGAQGAAAGLRIEQRMNPTVNPGASSTVSPAANSAVGSSTNPAVGQMRPMTMPSGNTAGATGPIMPPANDAEYFFERYKQHEDPNASGGFGRQKPSIPFGEDRTVTRKRDTYAETAADNDFDPDSIDFSRVAGYRNIYNQ